jgi:hypothetical protein
MKPLAVIRKLFSYFTSDGYGHVCSRHPANLSRYWNTTLIPGGGYKNSGVRCGVPVQQLREEGLKTAARAEGRQTKKGDKESLVRENQFVLGSLSGQLIQWKHRVLIK